MPKHWNTFDLETKTTQLLASAVRSRIGIRSFEQLLPKLALHIRRDRESPWLGIWGDSLNYDEYEHQQIVDRKILNVIGRLAGMSVSSGRVCHAGLIHTYGYLLSNLKTRFGAKRARWLNGRMEKSIGLKTRLFCPDQMCGSFFQNVSCLASRLVFSNRNGLNPWGDEIPRPLLDFDGSDLKRQRITETVRIDRQKLELFTDLISINKRSAEALLVYSYRYRREQKLVTLFLVSKTAWSELVAQPEGSRVLVRPRFNVFVSNFPASGLLGERRIEEIS